MHMFIYIHIYTYAYSSTESDKRTLQLQQRTTGMPVQLLSGRMCTLWVVKPETHAGHTQARMHSHTDTHRKNLSVNKSLY